MAAFRVNGPFVVEIILNYFVRPWMRNCGFATIVSVIVKTFQGMDLALVKSLEAGKNRPMSG